MRSKNKTSTDLSIDYSKSLIECVVTKKKFLGHSKRYMYVFEREIVINKVVHYVKVLRNKREEGLIGY